VGTRKEVEKSERKETGKAGLSIINKRWGGESRRNRGGDLAETKKGVLPGQKKKNLK